MPRTRISEFSATAADNTDIDSIDIAEGCAPSGINNAIRELMAQLKDFQTGAASDPFNGAVNGTLGATTPAAATVTSLSDSGNLTFTGTGNRIRGDFSNATAANRVAVQTSTTNGTTALNIIPNGTGAVSSLIAFSDSTLTNASFGQLRIEGSVDVRFISSFLGSGTYLPMTFYTGGSEAMRITTDRNVGIGTSSPAEKLHVLTSSNYAATFNSATTSATTTRISIGGFTTSAGGTGGSVAIGGEHNHAGTALSSMVFYTYGASLAERMRIDSSGNLLVGTTAIGASNNNGFTAETYAGGIITNVGHNGSAASGDAYTNFRRNGTVLGSITQVSSTGVLYNVTSDYRLKNDPQPLTGSKDFIMALQPKKWQWWDGSGEGVGFIAHEFMEVAKYSGNGEKDAVDANNKPVYQSIQPSSSEVMANLIGLVQEQQALIQDLTTRLTALEGN